MRSHRLTTAVVAVRFRLQTVEMALSLAQNPEKIKEEQTHRRLTARNLFPAAESAVEAARLLIVIWSSLESNMFLSVAYDASQRIDPRFHRGNVYRYFEFS